MLNVQKERFRHLVVGAILELWKKETGSTTSVLIEGTVCITAKNGRTTVIQVTDRSPNAIPDDTDNVQEDKLMEGITRLPESTPEKRRELFSPHSRSQSSGKYPCDSRSEFIVRRLSASNGKKKDSIKCGLKLRKTISTVNRQLGQQQLLQQHDQLVQRRFTPNRDSNNNHAAVADAELGDNDNSQPIADSDYDYDNDKKSGENSNFRIVDVDGLEDDDDDGCHENSGEDQNDSGITDMSVNLSALEPSTSPVKQSDMPVTSGSDSVIGVLDQEKGSILSAMDLSRRDADLLLSSPQSYTEQVREAVKRRLVSSVNPSLMPLGLSPFHSFVFPSTSTTPTSFPYCSDIFQKPRDSPFSCIPQNGSLNSWSASMARSGLPTSASQMDMRLLTSAFPTHHMNFATGGAMPVNIAQSPPMRQSLVNHPQSLHNMLANGLMTSGHLMSSPSNNKYASSLSMPRKVESESSEVDGSNGESKGSIESGDLGSGIHGEQRVYRCDYCSKTFLFKSKYHEHLPVHTSARPFQCHLCSRTYKYKYDLRVHLRAHLGIPTKSTVCPFCAEKFGTNKLLRQHILDAHKEQQAIGEEQCAKSLMNIAALAAARSAGSGESDGCDSNMSVDQKDLKTFDENSYSHDFKEDEDDEDDGNRAGREWNENDQFCVEMRNGNSNPAVTSTPAASKNLLNNESAITAVA